MATFVLTDLAHDVWVESFTLDNDALFLPPTAQCSVRKRRLRGGRRDGVDLIEVNNGGLAFSVVPTRGMNIWNGTYKGQRLGWTSPVADGPVNPAFVNLAANGGLGWLAGFDELLARCGLANNGAPFEVKARKDDGSESNTTFGLHGKIANTPASYVAVHVGDEPPHEIVIEGHVEETSLFGPQVRMITRIKTTPRSNHLVVHDEFVNLKDQPVECQILYHWNFGPPILEEGCASSRPPGRWSRATRARSRAWRITTFTARPSPDSPSNATSTICLHRRPMRARPWPCSATRAETRPSSCGFTRASFRASPSGRTRQACATATSRVWNRPRTTPMHFRSRRLAAVLSPCRSTAGTRSKPHSSP